MTIETQKAIIALTAAVMSLARDVNRLAPYGLSDETKEKCQDATCAVSEATRKDGGA